MAAMNSALGLNMTHMPYRGSGQSVPALLGGHVPVLFSAYPSLKGAVETNRVELLATNGAQRWPLAPDVPSFAEIIPGFDLDDADRHVCAFGHASGARREDRAEAIAAVKEPDVVPQFAALGMEPAGEDPRASGKPSKPRSRVSTKVVRAPASTAVTAGPACCYNGGHRLRSPRKCVMIVPHCRSTRLR